MNKNDIHNKKEPSLLERITRTVLYEGYSLYPYHRSSTKNAKPVPFGAVYPRQYQHYNHNVYSTTQTQCILKGSDEMEVEIRVRFLHLRNKQLLKIDHDSLGPGQFQPVGTLQEDGKKYTGGWEAVEREINIGTYSLSKLFNEPIKTNIAFEKEQANDLIYAENGTIAGNILINQSAINGSISVDAHPVGEAKNGYQITIRITNTTAIENAENCGRNDVYGQSFLSTNTILQTPQGRFISQADPEKEWESIVKKCTNINTWPVLIETDDKIMLSSPIVLYDHPQIAPESMGDMFDSTEIEEALMLHMATLSEDDKNKIDRNDPKMKAMLERVKSVTPSELMKLHGGLKEVKSNKTEKNKDELR